MGIFIVLFKNLKKMEVTVRDERNNSEAMYFCRFIYQYQVFLLSQNPNYSLCTFKLLFIQVIMYDSIFLGL